MEDLPLLKRFKRLCRHFAACFSMSLGMFREHFREYEAEGSGIQNWNSIIIENSQGMFGEALPRARDIVHQDRAGAWAEVRSAHGVDVGGGVAELCAHHRSTGAHTRLLLSST